MQKINFEVCWGEVLAYWHIVNALNHGHVQADVSSFTAFNFDYLFVLFICFLGMMVNMKVGFPNPN